MEQPLTAGCLLCCFVFVLQVIERCGTELPCLGTLADIEVEYALQVLCLVWCLILIHDYRGSHRFQDAPKEVPLGHKCAPLGNGRPLPSGATLDGCLRFIGYLGLSNAGNHFSIPMIPSLQIELA